MMFTQVIDSLSNLVLTGRVALVPVVLLLLAVFRVSARVRDADRLARDIRDRRGPCGRCRSIRG
jgi:hypothetical protein